MTVEEFYEALDGYRTRQDQARKRDAWIVHHLIAPYCKKGQVPSVDALLGRQRPATEADWDEFDRRVGGELSDDEERAAHVERMRAARRASQGVV
jgi:hypothetical protein